MAQGKPSVPPVAISLDDLARAVSVAFQQLMRQNNVFDGSQSVGGGIDISGTASFTSRVFFHDGIDVTGSATFANKVNTDSDYEHRAGRYHVSSTASFTSKVVMNSGLDISGTASIASTILLGGHKIVYDTAAPASGTWTVGDMAINSAPAVGQPKGWRCTVTGTPGTWVSEGNL